MSYVAGDLFSDLSKRGWAEFSGQILTKKFHLYMVLGSKIQNSFDHRGRSPSRTKHWMKLQKSQLSSSSPGPRSTSSLRHSAIASFSRELWTGGEILVELAADAEQPQAPWC